jgi:hypothetical protein
MEASTDRVSACKKEEESCARRDVVMAGLMGNMLLLTAGNTYLRETAAVLFVARSHLTRPQHRSWKKPSSTFFYVK